MINCTSENIIQSIWLKLLSSKQAPSPLRSLFVVGLFGLLIHGAGCEKQKETPKQIVRPVRTIVIKSASSERNRVFSGTAQAGLKSRLSFKVAGTLKRVSVNVGDQVSAGELLAELDPKDYRLQLEQAQAALEQAEAQLRNAQSTFLRTRELYANRTASKSELDQARAGAETSEAGVRAASKQVQLAEQQKAYTRLIAPVAGSIAQVKAEENENVGPGVIVVVLNSQDEIEVRVAVPEVVISKIKQGDRVKVWFDALKDMAFDASVHEVGVVAVEGGTTYPVTVSLDTAHKAIRPGMAAEVAFAMQGENNTTRILVPSAAVSQDHQGRFVYLVEKTKDDFGQVVRREVEVGELTSEGLEIKAGLLEGDVMVIAGIRFLQEGRKVRLPKSLRDW